MNGQACRRWEMMNKGYLQRLLPVHCSVRYCACCGVIAVISALDNRFDMLQLVGYLRWCGW